MGRCLPAASITHAGSSLQHNSRRGRGQNQTGMRLPSAIFETDLYALLHSNIG